MRAAILGAADGVTSIAGVVAAAGVASGPHKVARIALAGAASATISMAGGEFLSEEKTDWGSVGAMAAGTLLGSALPVLPLLVVAGTTGWALVVVVSLLIAVAVGEVRSRMRHITRATSYSVTVLLVVAGAAVGYLCGGA